MYVLVRLSHKAFFENSFQVRSLLICIWREPYHPQTSLARALSKSPQAAFIWPWEIIGISMAHHVTSHLLFHLCDENISVWHGFTRWSSAVNIFQGDDLLDAAVSFPGFTEMRTGWWLQPTPKWELAADPKAIVTWVIPGNETGRTNFQTNQRAIYIWIHMICLNHVQSVQHVFLEDVSTLFTLWYPVHTKIIGFRVQEIPRRF